VDPLGLARGIQPSLFGPSLLFGSLAGPSLRGASFGQGVFSPRLGATTGSVGLQ